MTTPPSPWIGSSSTATTVSSIAARRAAASPYGTVRKPGCVRPEVVAGVGVVRERHDRGGAAVEVPGRDDDRGLSGRDALDAVAPGARDLDRRLDRLGPGVHREHELGAGQFGERRRERAEPVVHEGTARQGHPVELGPGGVEQPRVAVAEVHRGVRGEPVQVALAVDVRHPRTVAGRDDDRERAVVVGEGAVLDGERGRGVGPRRGVHQDRATEVSVPTGCRSSVQHFTPPPPSRSSDRSTPIGL